MAKLEQYKDFEEKGLYFEDGNVKINTKAEFEVYWEKLVNYDELYTYKFRGCTEANFKLYNSSQRYWIEKELSKQNIYYHDFIKKLIAKCKNWNEKTIFKFFNLNGIGTNNALAYLSYMQHYGIPTPLLDFTHNPFIGLYFAVSNSHYDNSSENEINNYCSLYVVDESNPFFYSTIKTFEKEIVNEKNGDIDYDKYLISYPILFVTSENTAFKMLNNTNIVNQQGMFFYNNHPDLPIENVYYDSISFIKESMTEEEFSNLRYSNYFAYCWNFHKSLKPYILSKLREKRISEKFIFPDNKELKEYTLISTLEEI